MKCLVIDKLRLYSKEFKIAFSLICKEKSTSSTFFDTRKTNLFREFLEPISDRIHLFFIVVIFFKPFLLLRFFLWGFIRWITDDFLALNLEWWYDMILCTQQPCRQDRTHHSFWLVMGLLVLRLKARISSHSVGYFFAL